ncbi:MAG: histidine phosphatase family protein [Bowdeniella nasicola]|nr:histidine phosphatase family protein [Bowdeniella nasicola]
MSAARVLLLRHGQTNHNVERRVQGGIDIPLNDVGRAQAEEAGRALERELADTAVRIVASDLSRALATAEAAARQLGVDVVADSRLRERHFGQFEGLTGEELQEKYPAEYAVWRGGDTPELVGIETRPAVRARMIESIEEHAEQTPDGAALLVVSHGSAITQALRGMLGVAELGVPVFRGMDNCHWAELQPGSFGGGARWRLFAHNRGA